MSEFTNTSTESLGDLYGISIKPCMKSGFCCTKAPCGYGEWDGVKHECKYLLPANEIGQRDCGRYEWIIANILGYEFYPGFGTGCCMPMFNVAREQVIKNITSMDAVVDAQ